MNGKLLPVQKRFALCQFVFAYVLCVCVCVCEKVEMKILLISVTTYSNRIVFAPKVAVRSCLLD